MALLAPPPALAAETLTPHPVDTFGTAVPSTGKIAARFDTLQNHVAGRKPRLLVPLTAGLSQSGLLTSDWAKVRAAESQNNLF